MNFQVASDLHLEFYKDKEKGLPYLQVTAPYLILAGDIGNPFRRNYWLYLNWASHHYQRVFLLAGNHEYYGQKRSMEQVDRKIQELSSGFPNVTDLNSSCWQEAGLVIVGRTLWTDLSGCSPQHIKKNLRDYSSIHLEGRLIEPEDVTRLHREHLAFLETNLARWAKDPAVHQIIVVSHHAPSRLMLNPAYSGDDLGAAYANQLDELILASPKMIAWVSGHTHHSLEVKLSHCTLLSNCLGYRLPNGQFQSTGYDPNRTFMVQI